MRKHWFKVYYMLLAAMVLLTGCSKDPEVALNELQLESIEMSTTMTSLDVDCSLANLHGTMQLEFRCWSESTDTQVYAMEQAGLWSRRFSLHVEGLLPATAYGCAVVAMNDYGSRRLVDTAFTTVAPRPGEPVVLSITPSYREADIQGALMAVGNMAVDSCGICLATTSNPTVDDRCQCVALSQTGLFEFTFDSLQPGTTYHVRAFAKGAAGVGYGSDTVFRTLALQEPAVTTRTPYSIAATLFRTGGAIVSDGGLPVTACGVCCGTASQPTLDGSHVQAVLRADTFACVVNGLSPSSTYYVRAYAVNGSGVAYGEEYTVTTTAPMPPMVDFDDIYESSASSMTAKGTVVSDGGASVTETGFCWGTTPAPTIDNASHVQANATFTASVTGLAPNTVYYIRPYAVNALGVGYGDDFVTSSSFGALGGLFTVGVSQRVRFSQGNLRYRATTGEWRFADNQYEHIGMPNQAVADGYDGWIDLFGWGTSGWNSGANACDPWSVSTATADYMPGGSTSATLSGPYANADWGVYNAVSNGGNRAGKWRTLTHDEWNYLFNVRPGAANKAALATITVNGVSYTGVVVLPDSWTLPGYCEFHPGYANGYATNSYTQYQWDLMQQAGAVFLPASGRRSGSAVSDVDACGYYWSASIHTSRYAYDMNFSANAINVANGLGLRYMGEAVRLVVNE